MTKAGSSILLLATSSVRGPLPCHADSKVDVSDHLHTLRKENMLFRRKGHSREFTKLLLKSRAALQRTVTKQVEEVYDIKGFLYITVSLLKYKPAYTVRAS